MEHIHRTLESDPDKQAEQTIILTYDPTQIASLRVTGATESTRQDFMGSDLELELEYNTIPKCTVLSIHMPLQTIDKGTANPIPMSPPAIKHKCKSAKWDLKTMMPRG